MSAPASSLQLTYEDYLDFPSDGRRYELIEGDLCRMPTPTLTHQRVLGGLYIALARFLHDSRRGHLFLAPLDIVLSEVCVVQPDLLFLSPEHEGRMTEACIQGAPDLAVEILSESSRRHDEVTKRRLYAKFGVAEYWVVDPVIEAVRIYRLREEALVREAELTVESGDWLSSPLFSGLEIDLVEIFRS
jgi:Uma2 family endonuclease